MRPGAFSYSPASRPALSSNLAAKPSAEAKPKLGALGSGSKAGPGLGTIKMKPSLPVAALDDAKPDSAAAKPKVKPKPQVAAKPAPRPVKRADAPKPRSATTSE